MIGKKTGGAFASLAVALALFAGCSVQVAPPKTPAGGAGDLQKAWANVLSKYVDENGKIDFVGI